MRMLLWKSRILSAAQTGKANASNTRNFKTKRVLLHGAVVEAARVLQVVLDLDQLVRQLAEIRVGLELRIALLQEHELLQALVERALVAEALGERARAGGARAQLGHAREQRLFVGGIASYGLDQLRHEVGAALELHVDVGEALARLVAVGDQAVVNPGHGNKKQGDRRYYRGRHLLTLFLPAFFAR